MCILLYFLILFFSCQPFVHQFIKKNECEVCEIGIRAFNECLLN